jgi:glycosyltransferase involved in cell wall biosynthesis
VIRRIGVVIPARDESATVARCLRSVEVAAGRVDLPVTVVLVADGCLDDTAAIARAFPGVHVVELESSNVGSARAAGCRRAVKAGADWLANTDADSVVPANWLEVQRAFADEGATVVVGTVRPDFDDLDDSQREAWMRSHTPGRPNGHVHGANLGFRVSTYLASGGYSPLPEHEDVDLVERLASHGWSVATDAAEVVTSGRRYGRTPGGYARYLREDLLRRGADEVAAAAVD